MQKRTQTIESLSRIGEDLIKRVALLEKEVKLLKASKADGPEVRGSGTKVITTFKATIRRRTWSHGSINGKPQCPKCKRIFGNPGSAFLHLRTC
ncbi:MAG: hypothetical protein MHMPM18_001811 [Marteilia pararefringens]